MKELLLMIPLLLAACGGKVSDRFPLDATADSVDTSDAGAPDTATDDHCIQMLKALEPLRLDARACCATCGGLQCDVSAEDICCPISVTGKRLASAKFVEAVHSFKAQCHPACPATPCPLVPSGNCNGASGLCQP